MSLLLEFRDTEKRCLQYFQQHAVNFVLVGGYAVRAHGYLRSVGDLDLVIQTTEGNIRKTAQALGATSSALPSVFEAELFYWLKMNASSPWCWEPCNLDLLTAVERLKFEDLIASALMVHDGELDLSVISKEHLIEIKEGALDRRDCKAEQDREDIKALKLLDC
jgi:hypothetical protein